MSFPTWPFMFENKIKKKTTTIYSLFGSICSETYWNLLSWSLVIFFYIILSTHCALQSPRPDNQKVIFSLYKHCFSLNSEKHYAPEIIVSMWCQCFVTDTSFKEGWHLLFVSVKLDVTDIVFLPQSWCKRVFSCHCLIGNWRYLLSPGVTRGVLLFTAVY